MKTDIIELEVKSNKVHIVKVNNIEYISLTDLARYVNREEPKIPIQTWLRNKNVISFLGLWESLYNKNFKGHEFTTFENEAGKNSFYLSPQKWIKDTNAIGIISKSGNKGGTFAHPDIAFEFASWLSPEFKLYLIKEFERLKKEEANLYKIEWKANRLLSKLNYELHTSAINKYIVPTLTEEQKKFIYSDEADIINVALFGMTSKEWKKLNPKLCRNGNIRDYADLLHLVILNNLENTNSLLIEQKFSQRERLVKLNELAKKQFEILRNNKNIYELENLELQANDIKLITNDK